MQTIKHKLFVPGTVIRKELKEIGSYITVRFESNGMESRFAIPESFMTGLLIAEGDLKEEVEAAIEAKNKAEAAAREARGAVSVSSVRSSRTSGTHTWKVVVSNADKMVREDYEAYLINEDYTEITPKGAPSTIPQYMRAIESVLEEEHLTWSALEPQISHLVALYGDGGAKEVIGNKQHKTVINALKRFEEFC